MASINRKSSRIVRKTKLNDNCLKTKDKTSKKIKTNELTGNESQMSPYFGPIDRLSVDFFRNKTCIELSKALLGQILCRRLSPNGPTLKGRIVETEAYVGVEDKACKTYGGRRTPSNEPMYMSSGTCYVYFTYGMYHCFNVSAEGEGAAVLLRAIQPLEGIEHMQRLRSESRKGDNRKSGNEYKLHMLSNGPSKLCIAFDINRFNVNKVDITDCPLIWIQSGDSVCADDIVSSKRIGISRAEEWNDKELRFYIKDCLFVSRK